IGACGSAAVAAVVAAPVAEPSCAMTTPTATATTAAQARIMVRTVFNTIRPFMRETSEQQEASYNSKFAQTMVVRLGQLSLAYTKCAMNTCRRSCARDQSPVELRMVASPAVRE